MFDCPERIKRCAGFSAGVWALKGAKTRTENKRERYFITRSLLIFLITVDTLNLRITL
jgi:hypothetical protein